MRELDAQNRVTREDVKKLAADLRRQASAVGLRGAKYFVLVALAIVDPKGTLWRLQKRLDKMNGTASVEDESAEDESAEDEETDET